MHRLAILGASGHGKVVADIAEICGWKTIEFFDDDLISKGNTIGCWPVVGIINDFLMSPLSYDGVIVGIGNNQIRNKISEEILFRKIKLTTLIHPSASVSRHAQVGPGCVIVAGAVINAYAEIGRGVIVNTNASVDHDCRIGNYVHISPGANVAGGVSIGDNSWIGIGACVKQQISIGSSVVVGAGAAVVKNIPDDSMVMGIPARPYK